jgi:predicted ABC-type transport system involved in lysophospholipase L1 biosynthesis ATPase subunit
VRELLRAEGVQKSFGRVGAVQGVDLRIDEGESLAIIGRSGSGKSTLLNLLGGLEAVDEGRIFYHGEDITTMDEDALALWRRAHVGLVFQAFHLIATLSALENVAFPLYPDRMHAAERRRLARERLEQVGLEDRASHRPAELSGGEQQRVAIARALVHGPSLVLADEPTGNLDSQTGEEILALFHRLQADNKMALVIVTHDDKVAGFAGRVIRMADGRIVPGAQGRTVS